MKYAKLFLVIILATVFPKWLKGQCPTASMDVSSLQGCGSGVITLTFTHNADDDDDGVTIRYRIGTSAFTLNNAESGATASHTVTPPVTVTLVSITVTGDDDDDTCTSTINQSVNVTGGAAPSLNVNSNQPTCGQSNGSITAQAAGGTSPYQYSIGGAFQSSGSFNNLSSGSYTVTVRDANGCESSRNVTLSGGAVPNLTASASSQPTCGQSNGSITAQATGGTSPYQYSIGGAFQSSGSFSNLASGSYTVTVRDANGCESSRNITLSGGAVPNLTASASNQPTCGQSNGSITAQATGGTSPYQYSIGGAFQSSGSFNNLSSGSYTVTVRDANGCESSRNVTLSGGAVPNLTASASNQPTCGQNNGSINAQATGGTSPYQYRLNAGNFQATATFNNLAAGNYTVTVRDANGCESSRAVTLNSSSAPTLTTNVTAQPTCAQSNGSITAQATGGTSPYQYRLNAGNFQATATFNNLASGSYTVTVRDANGCESSSTITLDNASNFTLSISNTTQPSCQNKNGRFTVVVAGGDAPFSYSINGGTFGNNGNFVNLGAGQYTVRVRDSKNCEKSITLELKDVSSNFTTAQINTPNNNLFVCPSTAVNLSANLPQGTTGVWSSIPTGLNFANPNRNNTTIANPTAGQYKLIWTLSTSTCPNYSNAEVAISISGKPIAKDDNVIISSITKTIDILDNDVVEPSFFLDIVKAPTQGEGIIQADNAVIYTPFANAKGKDSFTYEICLATCPSSCDTALVTIELPNTVDPCNLEIVDQSVLFPEGITPNGDGVNDNLLFQIVDKIGCPTNYAKSDITIFNRWNDRIFVQEPYENQWDGNTQNGKPLPAGVYYYVLRVKREDKKDYLHFGNVTIFR